MAKEAYNRELNLYTLAHAMAIGERNTKDDEYRGYMCSQCGDIYDQACYKVVQISMLGVSPAPMSFVIKEKEWPTLTQELVGLSKRKANLQEPWPTTTLKFEAFVLISKYVQTLPLDTIVKYEAPILFSTSTQTLPQLTTHNVGTQTQPWNEQVIMNKWKKESTILLQKIL